MKKKLKSYSVHVQFHAHGVNVKAENQRAALIAAIEKLSKKKLTALIDRKNCYVDVN